MYRKADERTDPTSPDPAGGQLPAAPERQHLLPSVAAGAWGLVALRGRGKTQASSNLLTPRGSEPPKPRLTERGRAGTAVPDPACQGCAEMTHPTARSSTLPTSNK